MVSKHGICGWNRQHKCTGQEKKNWSYFYVENTVLGMKVSVWPEFCMFSALNCLWGFEKITLPLHLSSHLTSQDNDSRLNTLFWRGGNKIACKTKSFSDLKTSRVWTARRQNWGPIMSYVLFFFFHMKNLGTQVAFSSLLPMKVGSLEDKGFPGQWLAD